MILDRPLFTVAETLAREASIKYNFPVNRIDLCMQILLCFLYFVLMFWKANPSHITVHGPNGATLHAKRVIVTVSLNVLKSDMITFVPPLPAEKRGAMQRLKMNNTIKVIVVFAERIWPDNGMWDVCCPGTY